MQQIALALVFLVAAVTDAFTTTIYNCRQTPSSLQQSTSNTQDIHPAVADWPNRYNGEHNNGGTFHKGPRIMSHEFSVVRQASEDLQEQLDITNWPTWTTADKDKWAVGNLVPNKTMPYGELSYMTSGQLEITTATETTIVEAGDLVTFPEGFTASWRVLEELNWHYYLY